jgi:methionyl-tRNA formyltransferase
MTRVALLGSQKIAVAFLDFLTARDDVEVALVVGCDSERDASLGYESLLARASALDVPAIDAADDDQVLSSLRSIEPDILFSVYYRKLLPPEVLRIPRLGCVNIHPGLLPEYRGATPTAWALLNGETKFGITIHYMDATFDTGDILVQEAHDIDPDETGYELRVRAMSLGEELLRRNFDGIVNQTLTPIAQEGSGSYFGKLDTDYRIDWSDEAEAIRNAVRVYASPYSRARTSLGDKSILVNHVAVLGEGDRYAMRSPGEIADVLSGGVLVVAAADGFLLVDDYEVLPPMTEAEREGLLREGDRLL